MIRGSFLDFIRLIRSFRVVVDRDEARDDSEVGCCGNVVFRFDKSMDGEVGTSAEIEVSSLVKEEPLSVLGEDENASSDLTVVLPLRGAVEANEKVDNLSIWLIFSGGNASMVISVVGRVPYSNLFLAREKVVNLSIRSDRTLE